MESDIWRRSAEIYLQKMWFGQNEQDRRLVSAFSRGPVTSEMLRDLCSPAKYGVARTVPGHGTGKYKRFAEMLNSHRDTLMTKQNTAEIVEKGLADMQVAYGRGFLSAITKALWMMKQHPVVIYDSNARSGLRKLRPAPEYKDYRSYFDAWFRFFDEPDTQTGLDDGLSWLPLSVAAKALVQGGKADSQEIQRLAESTLFRNRVMDIRLFYAGGGTL